MSVPCSKEWSEVWVALRDFIDEAILARIYEHECRTHKDMISCELYRREEDKLTGYADMLDEAVKSLLSCLKGKWDR